MQLTDKIHILQIDFEVAIAPGKVIPRFVNVLVIFGEKIKLIDALLPVQSGFINSVIA